MRKKSKLLSMVLVMVIMLSVICTYPASAEVTNLLQNGGFESGKVTPWGFSFKDGSGADVSFENSLKFAGAAEGDYYLDLKGLTGTLSYIINDLAPYKRYGITFSMKSSIANVIAPYVTYYGTNDAGNVVEYNEANFKSIDPEYNNVFTHSYSINNDQQYKMGIAYTDEVDKTTWQTVGFELPTQSSRITKAVVKFRVLSADAYLCLDNFSLTAHEGEYNYISNGSLEYMRGKDTATTWNMGMDVDDKGNRVKYLATNTNTVKMTQTVNLTSGRYKLSFRAKMDVANTRVFFHMLCSDSSVTWTNYGLHVANGAYGTVGFIPDTEWNDAEYYFTLPTDSSGNVKAYTVNFMLPSTRVGVNYITGGYYDDFKIVKDENSIEFSEYVWRTKVDFGGRALCKVNTANSISAAKGAGKTQIPVTSIVYPKVADGISETAFLVACIYKTDGGMRKLVDLSVVSGSTNETDSADTTNGANAYGILSLTTSIAIPEEADSTYTVEAFLLDTLSGMTPLSDKAVLTY